MPDWLTTTLAALPALLWIVLGVGLPWAMVTLPRRDWRDRAMVACLALGFGPMLLTAWMLILGTLGRDHTPGAGDSPNPMQTRIMTHVGGDYLLRPELILVGTIVLALLGIVLAVYKARRTSATARQGQPLATDEKVIIVLIGVATLARFLLSSWLSFGSWDPLWVYGYQGRLYTLLGYIPSDIGYYPQFLPLQYAYTQIVAIGGISDHAARAVLPFLQVGSILATYVLGSKLVNRRTGIIAAALWAFYPHFSYWTRIGDLEIPVTFTFTAAAAFFLTAWFAQERHLRRQYALIGGLFLGIAMWTKPTAGALIWGVVLAVVVEFVRVRFDWQRWLPRFVVAFWMGVATIPLGAIWYIRNVLIGHAAVNFPPSYWLDEAMRSGREFGWPLLALGILLAYLYLGHHRPRPALQRVIVGVLLIAAGVMPTILEPARMGIWEWLALAAGSLTLGSALWRHARNHMGQRGWYHAAVVGWVVVLALPYFVTWFYSYSYHYRLSFTIVPLMILPTAIMLSAWFNPARVNGWPFLKRSAYAGAVLIIGIGGFANVIYDQKQGWDWLWTRSEQTEREISALNNVVEHLEDYIATHDEPPVIVAPGMQRLPFYFPRQDIRVTATPLALDQLDGVTHFIFSQPQGHIAYRTAGHEPTFPGTRLPYQSSLFSSLFRENVVQERTIYEDTSYSYAIYRVDTSQRFERPPDPLVTFDRPIVFGDFAKLIGYSYADTTLDYSPEYTDLHFVFEVTGSVQEDYFLYVHLVKPPDVDIPLDTEDGPVKAQNDTNNYYSTLFWEPGEYVIDRRLLWHNPHGEWGEGYRLRIGFYSQVDGQRVEVTVGGEPAGDGFMLPTEFTLPEPSNQE